MRTRPAPGATFARARGKRVGKLPARFGNSCVHLRNSVISNHVSGVLMHTVEWVARNTLHAALTKMAKALGLALNKRPAGEITQTQ